MANETLRGILFFYSETGTEGGYWTFQDERFIKPNTTRMGCVVCGAYWDTEKSEAPPADTLSAEEREKRSSSEARRSITAASGRTLVYCEPGAHAFEPISPETWSYEGMHELRDGDQLTIFDKNEPSTVIWSGTIALDRHKPFTKSIRNMWVHSEQKGVDPETWWQWFNDHHPAELVRAPV
jgi:hypothetical protein